MTRDVDVVVIGSVGAATAHFLMRPGGRRVIGEELVRWIVDGRASEDLGAMLSARFGPAWRDEQRLRRAAAREYRHVRSHDAPGG